MVRGRAGHSHSHVGLLENAREVRRVLLYTLLMNEAVAVAKIVWGLLSGSLGMLSDGLHSLFDGVTNVVGLIGIWVASHPPDAEHPYGHKKFETVFTIVVSGLIFMTCLGVLERVYRSLSDEREVEVTIVSFAVMAVTIAVNFWVMVYEKRKGRELGSDFLMADAMHTKSNLLSSAGVVAGLVFTGIGYPAADAIAGVVVAAFIARIGYDILRSAADVLVDTVCIDTGAICRVALEVEGVRDCHKIRTRGSEHHVHLDLHIHLDPEMTLERAHEITHRVQDKLKEAFPQVTDIVVHTEPEGGRRGA
jgi:cation diffusion facilitator family transporter